ncbi:MAG: hypothetical protein ACXWP1_00130 [Bdellovibrionota bacterium]
MKAVLLFLLTSSTAFADMPSVHGMLLFGAGKVYISHLPMFHSPHDYQALAEIELPPAAAAAYQKSRASHPGDKLYTLVPETFSLPEMMAHPHPFSAELFHGHFERGGDSFAQNVQVNIKRVPFFRKFVPGQQKPESESYLLFGTPGEAFLAHFITAKPDFDQVLAVNSAVAEAGKVISLLSDSSSPLPESGPVDLSLNGKAAGISVLQQIYLETGDLAH